MDIASTLPNTSIAATDAAAAPISSDFETFLKMLTVQLENQDPLNPTDSSDYAQQLATFSGVEQAVLTNDLLSAMMLQMNTNGMAEMADWVGKEARATAPAYFDGSPVTVAPDPASVADNAELVVYNTAGIEVQRLQIPVSSNPVEWAGTSSDGTPFPTGLYSFKVESFSDGDVTENTAADVYSRVQEVRIEGGETVLILAGDVPVVASAVTALREF